MGQGAEDMDMQWARETASKPRADLCAEPALLAEAVEVLRTLRDYVDDASRGFLRYRGKSDISEMAGEDLVILDNVIAKLENRHDR